MNTRINITVSPFQLLPAGPVPATPKVSVSLCKHCGQWADCQPVTTADGYEELAGDYCADCLTTALIYLKQEGVAYILSSADHRDLLRQLIDARGEKGVTDEEARALAHWADTIAKQGEMLSLALMGEAHIADMRDGMPCFAFPTAEIEMEPGQ